MEDKTYIAIDLKSFYASVECVARGLDPVRTNLVVADESRTDKTICLAVSPSLKALGISGRARLFEAKRQIKAANGTRLFNAPGRRFRGKSYDAVELENDPSLELDYIVAPPRMSLYMEVSKQIYGIYLRYVAPEDIHVYSIDEVFIDATDYLRFYRTTPRGFTIMLIRAVLEETGITATAGIGTNMYLCKVAMDIVAKRIPPDKDGVRIAELDEESYRRELWDHTPITDFWRVGHGTAARLERLGLFTMGDVARCSAYNEDALYRLFGINAELLIDHAWGWEPCTIARVKEYRPESNSLSSGQVLKRPYKAAEGRLIVREMTDMLVLDMVDRGLVCDQMVLSVCYDVGNLTDPDTAFYYKGEVTLDYYGRKVPKTAHGSVNLGGFTSSTWTVMDAVSELYDRIVDPFLMVRRMYVVANHVKSESAVCAPCAPEQLDLFTDYAEKGRREADAQAALQREKRMQKALITIKKRYGKNAILKGMNFEDGATARERNRQVGGHMA